MDNPARDREPDTDTTTGTPARPPEGSDPNRATVKRHPVDWLSLCAGLVFLACAGAFFLTPAPLEAAQLRFVVPAALVAIGVAVLASARRPPR